MNTIDTRRRRANHLDGRTWTKHSISIWSDIRKSQEELRLDHPALFPVQLVTRLLECFTTRDDRIVLDPFAGVGSTIVAAQQMEKQGIGIEISPEYAAAARSRLVTRFPFASPEGKSIVHHGNAVDLLDWVRPDSVDIAITSPPYWNILTRKRTADQKAIRDYGEAIEDLGKISEYPEFLQALQGIFRLVYTTLKRGKYCLVVVMDLRRESTLYPLHLDVISVMQKIGFTFDDLIIWDRRQEYNNLRPLGYPYVFRINRTHEFILIFQKRG